MQTNVENIDLRFAKDRLEEGGTVLQIAGWGSFISQIALSAVCVILLLLAISGWSFNQEIAPGTEMSTSIETTPGLGVAIFLAICSFLVLLFGVYFGFRLTRFSKRVRNPNPAVHPIQDNVMNVLRLAVITGFIGMLVAILGSGITLGVLLAKSVAQPQGVAIYDPNRAIRSLDIFVAAANTTTIAAHFIGAVAALGTLNWVYRRSD